MTAAKATVQLASMILLMTLFSVPNALAATVNAASCALANVQTAVNAAGNGDLVIVPAGTCSWSGRVSWSNKNIQVLGAGIGVTVVQGTTLFSITAETSASFRISGFTFTSGGEANEAIKITNQNTSNFTKGWRIDHNRFLYSNAGETIAVYGLTWGVIDHNTWDTSGTSASPLYIYGFTNLENGTGSSLYGSTYWNRPMNLGTDEAIYFEDNTVNYANSGGVPFLYDMDFGGAIVVRYNTIHNAYVQTHSARGTGRGGKKYEIYRNVFTDSNFRFALKRSGSGVFFNNQVTGSATSIDIDSQHIGGSCAFSDSPVGICGAGNSYDGRVESNGWPCMDQPGRGGSLTGSVQESTPLYAWNNGTTNTCVSGGSCNNTTTIGLNCSDQGAYIKSTPHSNGQVDYVNNGSTPKPGYTPYTYPHPLVSGGAPLLSAPTNLRIIR